jgi:cobalt-zinc-cadmium efflux system membrane fusion protein
VRAILDNSGGRLRPGLFGDGRIFTAGKNQTGTVLVPLDAVQRLGEGKIVFVPGEHEGEYRARRVETAESGDRFVEIRNGLSPGTPVVARGAFDLKAALTAGGRSAAHGH